MITSVLIGNVEYISKVKLTGGVSYIERLDIELDSGTLILPFLSLSTPFKPFEKVKITINGETIGLFVLNDNVQVACAKPLLYRHVIALIEPSKLLEKYSCFSMAFTQPLANEFPKYTLKDFFTRLRNNVPLETSSKHEQTRLFDLGAEYNELVNFELPETALNKPNMREAFDRGLSYVDAICRARIGNNRLELGIDYFNKLNTLVDFMNKSTNINKNHDAEMFYSEAESYVENAITEYVNTATPNGVLMTFRTDSINITTENMEVITRLPIDRIHQAKMQVKYIWSTLPDVEIMIDITEFIYEKQLWDALPEPGPIERTSATARSKGNCVYFNRGSNKIVGWGTPISGIWGFVTESLIIRLITRALMEQYPTLEWDDISTSIEDFKIQVQYYAQSNLLLRMDKQGYDGDYKTQMPTNQSSNQVDIDLMGKNMTNTIKKLGNKEVQFVNRVKTWSERVKVGDYTSDGYIVTAVENNIRPNFIIQTCEASKDYNKMSIYVGVNQEARQIPLPRDAFDVSLHYKEYMLISNTVSINNDSSLKIQFAKILSEALTNNNGRSIADYGVFFTSSAITHWVYNEANIFKSDNSLVLQWGFNSNILAGKRYMPPSDPDNPTTRPLMQNIRYTDEYGRFAQFKWLFTIFSSHEFVPPLNPDQYANRLPLINYPSDVDNVNPMIETDDFEYLKDSSEILKFTYQVPVLSDNSSIIVGDKFWNILLGGTSNRLYASLNQAYNTNFNKKTVGTLTGSVGDYFDISYNNEGVVIVYRLTEWQEVSAQSYVDSWRVDSVDNTCPDDSILKDAIIDNPTILINDVVKVDGYLTLDGEVYLCKTLYFKKVKGDASFYESVGFADENGNLILGINKTQNGQPFYINFKNKKGVV